MPSGKFSVEPAASRLPSRLPVACSVSSAGTADVTVALSCLGEPGGVAFPRVTWKWEGSPRGSPRPPPALEEGSGPSELGSPLCLVGPSPPCSAAETRACGLASHCACAAGHLQGCPQRRRAERRPGVAREARLLVWAQLAGLVSLAGLCAQAGPSLMSTC